MENTNEKYINDLFEEMLDLCEERGLTGEEMFVIGAMVDDKESAARYGKEESIRIAMSAIKICRNPDEVFEAIEALFLFDD